MRVNIQLGWVDFSREDRKKTLDIMQLLSQGTLDELGIGLIRDSISEILFPGTSTIHTRAKYFFIVPDILQKLKQDICSKKIKGVNYQSAVKHLETVEHTVTKILCENNPDELGIIGSSRANDIAWVKRGPTEVYWSSLKKYDFIKDKNITISNCIRNIIKSCENSLEKQSARAEEDDSDAGNYKITSLLDKELVKLLPLKDTSITLNKEQAKYLSKKIIESYPDSLLGVILNNKQLMKEVIALDNFNALSQFVKQHKLIDFKTQIKLAKDFSLFVYVLRIMYNIIISERSNEEAIKEFDENKDKLEKISDNLCIDIIFNVFNVKKDTGLIIFLKNAKNAMKKNDIEALKEIITKREKALKREARAKTCSPSIDKYKNNWQGGKELDYRFFQAQNLVNEIYSVL